MNAALKPVEQPTTRLTVWHRVRRVWATVGSIAFVGFVSWCAIAYRASGSAKAALVSDAVVRVVPGDRWWRFSPNNVPATGVNLLFFPGALVDPVAYAPLLHHVAATGTTAYLVAIPARGAFGRADGDDFLASMRAFMDTIPGRWVVAGLSRGAKIAALLSRQPTVEMVGLILLGSTHPRDFTLADSRLAVTKVYGTKDGVASAVDVLANAPLLPESTHWIRIDGGNHNQFGSYGFQPGDSWAGITRDAQQAQTLEATSAALTRAAARH